MASTKRHLPLVLRAELPSKSPETTLAFPKLIPLPPIPNSFLETGALGGFRFVCMFSCQRHKTVRNRASEK